MNKNSKEAFEEQRKQAAESAIVENLNDKIDFSKIKNLDALQAVDRQAAAAIEKKMTPHKANKRKFCFMDAVEFHLPSKGKFYQDSEDEDLRNGIIKMYPMSVAEEELLTNPAYLKSGAAFRMLFDACMESDYDAGKLLSYDSTYLLYALRNVSYGSDYTFKVKCDECGKEFTHTIDLSDIDFNDLPEDAKDVYDIELPCSKYTVEMNLPRIKQDENVIRIKKEHENISDTTADFISHTLSIKTKEGEELNPKDWIDFYQALPAIDRTKITKTFAFTKNNPKVNIICPNCGNEIKVGIPMDTDFFRLS